MTKEQQARIARLEARNRTYEGFGERRGGSAWANLLGIPRNSFWRYLRAGMTVEQICEMKGVTYTPENPIEAPTVKARKPRYSANMDETRQLIYRLLIVSGYIINEGPECVEVKPLKNKQHALTFNGRPMGSYNYESGILSLAPNEGLPIKELDWTTARILRNSYGFWEVHPLTRLEVNKWALKKREEKKAKTI